jgi:hypothetical protein
LNFKDYQARALLTESKPDTLNFGEVGLHILLNAAENVSEILNLAKRTIFYGKPMEHDKLRHLAEGMAGYGRLIYSLSDQLELKNDRENFGSLPPEAANIKPENVNLRLLHSAMGIFTEAGEAIELVRKQLEGQEFDTVGWGEEIGGDISWYQALGHDAAGTDEDVEREKNIRKLELRNKGKTFNAEATVNRDTEAERAILEGKA